MKLLKFSSSWCGPCQQLERVISSTTLSIPVQSIDIDNDPLLAREYKIRGIPTLILLDEAGNELNRKTGAMSKEALLEFINQDLTPPN